MRKPAFNDHSTMNLNDMIAPERVLANVAAESKKRAFELLSELLGKNQPALTEAGILQSLVARERLGSTAIGGGVAVPHGRIQGLGGTVGALIRLSVPVDYQAEDRVPVDLMFALLLPQACSREQAGIVAAASWRLSDPELRRRLRAAPTSQALYEDFSRGDAAGEAHRMGRRA